MNHDYYTSRCAKNARTCTLGWIDNRVQVRTFREQPGEKCTRYDKWYRPPIAHPRYGGIGPTKYKLGRISDWTPSVPNHILRKAQANKCSQNVPVKHNVLVRKTYTCTFTCRLAESGRILPAPVIIKIRDITSECGYRVVGIYAL